MTVSLDLTVETERGEVDVVAVERVLAGIPTPLTAVERGYLLTMLVRSLDAKPAPVGYCLSIDPRIVLAAAGLETDPEALRDRYAMHKRRHGLDLPGKQAPRRARPDAILSPDCRRCGSPMPVGTMRKYGCRVCKTATARRRRERKRSQ